MTVDWENIIKNLEASLCYKLLDRFRLKTLISILILDVFTTLWLVLFWAVYASDVTFTINRFSCPVEEKCRHLWPTLDCAWIFSSDYDRCSQSQFLRFWSVWIKTFLPLLLGTWFLTYFFVITWIFDEFAIRRLLSSLKSIQM